MGYRESQGDVYEEGFCCFNLFRRTRAWVGLG